MPGGLVGGPDRASAHSLHERRPVSSEAASRFAAQWPMTFPHLILELFPVR